MMTEEAEALLRHLGQHGWNEVMAARDGCLVALLLSGIAGHTLRRMPATALEVLRLPSEAWRLVRRWTLVRPEGRLELLLAVDGYPLGVGTIRAALKRRARLCKIGRKLRASDLLKTPYWRDAPRVQCPWLGQHPRSWRRKRRS